VQITQQDAAFVFGDSLPGIVLGNSDKAGAHDREQAKE
jgi:hypothetical protein